MRTTFSLLLTYFLHLTTPHIGWTIPLNNSDDAMVEMPLVTNNMKAPLVADLDVSSLNKQLKLYIDIAISTTFTSKVKEIVEHSQDELRTTMLTTYKERLQESKTVYEEDLAHLVDGFKSRLGSLFSDLTENVTDLIDNLEEWKKGYTQTISEKYRPVNLPRDCTDIKKSNTKSGVYTIYPDNVNGIKVYCDMDVDGGGWIVIQRRSERKVKFERTWNEYENGFGEVAGEHWLADGLQRQSSGKFSAIDRDNSGGNNYAVSHGAWWYKSGSNTWLNDDQRENYWKKYIGPKSTMMIRRL
ncbi:angiopoietin-2-like [Mytilus californianus]|uniref:angiopoietin-2-like n=1 Tax=Mytilus californianus TaxID=6549 RepID=UPI0022455ABE|nr:angiopoietin-2-like [Mytilus californianus]